jgi:hypothetical protein
VAGLKALRDRPLTQIDPDSILEGEEQTPVSLKATDRRVVLTIMTGEGKEFSRRTRRTVGLLSTKLAVEVGKEVGHGR